MNEFISWKIPQSSPNISWSEESVVSRFAILLKRTPFFSEDPRGPKINRISKKQAANASNKKDTQIIKKQPKMTQNDPKMTPK